MTGLIGEKRQKGRLGTAVALAKGMDGFQRREERRYLFRKVICRQVAKIALLLQIVEECGHFPLNVFGIAESAAVFGYPDGSELASPDIDILKQVMMKHAVMRNA